ncbi:Protein MAIN-LIKE 2 [Glycine soja]
MEIMVRTRGLGHALASVIGRVDVPQRRRPTASARRQRVHIKIDEGVPQVTEDVPHMAEDVPQMTADIDATVAEDLGHDGAEGSHADEGFPGWPRDPSVLTSFAEHVAHAIWTGQERPELKLVSHGRKMALIGRPVPAIEGLVIATGLSPLIECSFVTGDPGLISAFVERWHKETSTFHLPVGELTITLNDVSSLLYLPINGAFHSFEALSMDEAVFLLMELLEVSGEEARAVTVRAHGEYVRLSWVRAIYEMRCQAQRWIVATRAYLLHLVGCTLFSNKSATNVHVVHLEAFRNLGQSGGYSWGAAALCWIYEHFSSVHQCVTDDAYEEKSPRASRWLTMKAHMKGFTGAPYRARCDALTVIDVCWLPYSDHRGVRGFELISSFQGQLRWGPTMVTVDAFLEPRSSCGDLCVEPGQVSADYMEWFFQISHSFMIPTQAGDQPRHAPAPDHEDYMQLDIPQVPVAFDPPPPRHAVVRLLSQDDYEGYEAIAERLERVLNLRMVTAGTELHDIVQDCLRITRGCQCRRKC